MKNKLIYIVLAIIGVIALSVYFALGNPFLKEESPAQDKNAESEEVKQVEDSENNNEADLKGVPPTNQTTNNIVTDDFEITPPPGWEGRPAPEGVLAIAIKPSEVMTDTEATKIGFKSYFAVTKDTLQGNTKEEYVSFIGEELKKISSSVTLDTVWSTKVDRKDATVLDISMTQENINFKISMFLVWNGDDIWVISFNTTEDKWNEYQDAFFTSGNSFRLK
jgi:hypothetical protein